MGVGGQRHATAAFTPGKDPVPIAQEAGWAPGPVQIGAVNLAPTGIRSPDLPARSESLYRPSAQRINVHKLKLNSVALVRERTIPTERPPPVGEVSANFCG